LRRIAGDSLPKQIQNRQSFNNSLDMYNSELDQTSRTSSVLKVACCSLFTMNCLLCAQTWQQTSAPTNEWYCVASSADGVKLVAGASGLLSLSGRPGSLFTSSNSGISWTQAAAPSNYWQSVCSSADGTMMFAVAFLPANTFFISIDSGLTWVSHNLPDASVPAYWWSIVCSADGAKLAGILFDSNNQAWICTSTNSGLTWARATNAPIANWDCITSSADGTKLVAGVSGVVNGYPVPGPIYVSTNSGYTWTLTSAPIRHWNCLASSADGSKLVAAEYTPGSIYTSTNAGLTWTPPNPLLPQRFWTSVASSADGSRLIAVNASARGDGVYVSTDSGNSWMAITGTPKKWHSAASSADGSKALAVCFYDIWTLQTVSAPVLDLLQCNGGVSISWILPSTAYVLQQNADLTTTDWLTLTNTPALDLTTLRNHITNLTTHRSGFYRPITRQSTTENGAQQNHHVER